MSNTCCPACGFDIKMQPTRKRKCPSCKIQLFVVKDYYKVCRELLYKVQNEEELEPDRFAVADEYDLYASNKWLLERLWYAGVLINDKAQNPAPFPGFFSTKIDFEISVAEFKQMFVRYPSTSTLDVFLIVTPKMIAANVGNDFTLSFVFDLLARLCESKDKDQSYQYYKKSVEHDISWRLIPSYREHKRFA